MSDETVKFSRTLRRHQKRRHIGRQVDLVQTLSPDYLRRVKSSHKFHKKNALNCGDPNCTMCGNPRKFFSELTIQEKKALQEEIDWNDES